MLKFILYLVWASKNNDFKLENPLLKKALQMESLFLINSKIFNSI